MSAGLYCVYKHTSPCGKVYIGVTSLRPDRRWESGSGYKYNHHFWSAIQKYGWCNFSHEILFDNLQKDEAFSKEVELISAYRATDPRFGYNQTMGGCGGASGVKNTEETRQRKRESALLAWQRPRKGVQKRTTPIVKRGHKKTPVCQYTTEGVLIKTWESMCEIERVLGIPTSRISECCSGKRGSCKGFVWKTAEVVV